MTDEQGDPVPAGAAPALDITIELAEAYATGNPFPAAKEHPNVVAVHVQRLACAYLALTERLHVVEQERDVRSREMNAVSVQALRLTVQLTQLRDNCADQVERLRVVEQELTRLKDRRFPIQNGPAIPWSAIAPHERQALHNHGGQTLERLAERGGLSPCEAVAVLEGRDWHQMNHEHARHRLAELSTPEITQLRSALAALEHDIRMTAYADARLMIDRWADQLAALRGAWESQ